MALQLWKAMFAVPTCASVALVGLSNTPPVVSMIGILSSDVMPGTNWLDCRVNHSCLVAPPTCCPIGENVYHAANTLFIAGLKSKTKPWPLVTVLNQLPDRR